MKRRGLRMKGSGGGGSKAKVRVERCYLRVSEVEL